jgi:class 3 adenylate cyclase
MTCPACRHANRETARFCESCGVRLEARCPACGSVTRAAARFCDTCGQTLGPIPAHQASDAAGDTAVLETTRVEEQRRAPSSYTPRHLVERILAEGRSLRGARREVTVLFVDVQGSTELASSLDPEAFHAVMDGAFQIMLDAVHHWEGTVNQFTGDGIMALFGAPIAHEDHARRALHASLEIQRGFSDYADRLRGERGLSFQARLGLNSGPVIVGAIGDDLRMDYTAQGLTTNLAARMQQAADPGSILVATSTYRLAEGYFRFRALPPMRVRGVAEPVEAHVLEGEGSVASRLEASLRRGASPFRGREHELVTLGQAWERVLAGRGGAICLVGEPGIGKSRLAYEFHRSVGLTERVEAAALAHARGAAYFAVRQLLRQLAGIPPEADLSESRETLHRRLWDLAPALIGHMSDLLFIIGTPCENPPAAPAARDERRDRLRTAVLDWIRAECRRQPRVVVIEDLQWLDPSSEEILRHLSVAAKGLPLLILLTSRLPIAGTNLELAGIHEVRVPALSPSDIGALVDAQVEPYAAGPRLRRIAAVRSEGNPFYVEELVRAFREQGHLALHRGSYEIGEQAERLVPASISALITSRIDRLPASARDVLADAAALGTHFPLAHLAALADSERFDDDVALAERRGLLERHHEGSMAGLAFRHVLMCEVVYGSLLQTDRQARHRRAAEMLERLYRGRTEEVCDQLARQWAQSDCRVRALPYLLSASDAAVTVGANREGIGYLESALELAGEHPDALSREQVASLRLKLAGLHFIVGED